MLHNLAFILAFAATPAGAEPVSGQLAAEFLGLHNAARDDAKLPHLAWSADLAKAAEPWARKLAKEGRLRHSDWEDRAGTGENLWLGTAGFYRPREMIGSFLSEKKDFRPGTFPNISKTGRWEDVGHYTQIIWPSTTTVGCAMAQGKGYDVLVCRYGPAGNVMGGKVG